MRRSARRLPPRATDRNNWSSGYSRPPVPGTHPLDGGNVARNVLLQVDPMDGVRKSLWVSVAAGALIALLAFFFLGSLYMAVLFGFLAFQSYQSLQARF